MSNTLSFMLNQRFNKTFNLADSVFNTPLYVTTPLYSITAPIWPIIVGLMIFLVVKYLNNPYHSDKTLSVIITILHINFLYDLTQLPQMLILISLLLDACSDYYIHKVPLAHTLLGFGTSHIIKQLAFITNYQDLDDIILYIIILTIILYIYMLSAKHKIISYIGILILSFLNISYMINGISMSYLYFIVSDTIIGLDLFASFRGLNIQMDPLFRYMLVQTLYLNTHSLLIGELFQ